MFLADTVSEALRDVLFGTLVGNLADKLDQVKSETLGKNSEDEGLETWCHTGRWRAEALVKKLVATLAKVEA